MRRPHFPDRLLTVQVAMAGVDGVGASSDGSAQVAAKVLAAYLPFCMQTIVGGGITVQCYLTGLLCSR